MKLKNKTTGQWDQLYLAGYAAMPELDTAVTAGSQNAVTGGAIKTYVDNRTIPYVNNGYYQTPTAWTIVTEMPSTWQSGMLYLVCPDWVMKEYFMCNLSGTLDSTIDFESVTCVMQNPNDHTQQQSFSLTYPTSYDSSSKKVPQYACDVGLIPYFIRESGTSQQVDMQGTLEGRDSNTYLRDYATLSAYEIANGTTYYFTSSGYDETRPLYSPDLTYSLNISVYMDGGVACLTGDTLIRTIAGDKAIKDLKVGDAVLNAEHQPVLVTKIYSHEVSTLYRITLSNKDEFLATESHKIRTTRGTVTCFALVKDLEVLRYDGSTFRVMAHEKIDMRNPIKVYEIQTETGTYLLSNGVINESEDI